LKTFSLIAALWLCALGSVAFAKEIILKSQDGALTVEGDFLSFDGEFYRIDTVYGPLTLDAQRVTCTGEACPDPSTYVAEIRISGTPHMADRLIPALLIAFAEQRGFRVERQVLNDRNSTFRMHDDERLRATFSLRATTTREGYADLIAEEADIALALREPDEQERRLAAQSGSGNFAQGRRARIVAHDGIVAVVAPGQGIKKLSLTQLKAAFLDPSPTWSGFGGPDRPISLHIPLHDSGLASAFKAVLLQDTQYSDAAAAHSSLETLATLVAADPFALGLTTFSKVGNAAPLAIVGTCGYDQLPTIDALRAEEYPLALPLMIFTPARRLPLLAREFLEFSESSRAHLVARRLGLADRSITQASFNTQGNRLAYAITTSGEKTLTDLQAMVTALKGRKRLSTTFRFKNGAKDLDVLSRDNMAHLARALEAGSFDGSDMLFVGFSGDPEPEGNPARKQAGAVLATLRERAPAANLNGMKMRTAGFENVLPIACDDTEASRVVNERVEVWVK